MAYSPLLQKASFSEIEPDVHGRISKRTADLEGVSATQVTFHSGARWSVDLKPDAGTETCLLPHVAVVTAGALGVEAADGQTEVYRAGDVMLLPPAHDAWTVGNEDCVFVEFSRGNDYYADEE